ncbi:MAG TPA: RDD family protein [Solirubrobacteraceae bacterium]|nr:RDD family protein [Solirubrobacteraceae bacterium]
MELDDVITLATPEGVELEMSLAGAGSRLIAGAIDLAIQTVLIGALLIGLLAAGTFGLALFSIGSFVVLFAYDVLFEVLGAGQTPGKRLQGLRVVRSDGSPVDLRSSAVRNITRLLDGPPLTYMPTLIGIIVTKNNQRPGDLAGDTVVIRTARRVRRRRRGRGSSTAAAPIAVAAADWDVSAITPDELAVVRRFIERRDQLAPPARRALALRLAGGLAPRVVGAPPDGAPELFLETLLATKAGRSGLLARPVAPS